MAARVPGAASRQLLFALLASFLLAAAGRRLHLGSCAVSVHTHELKQYFSEIRKSVSTEDDHLGLKLLKAHTMKDVQPAESCCFLRMLLRFYVERVFGSYATGQSQLRRSTSNLANSFLSIKKDLRHCMHCRCQEETNIKFAAILANFEKLDQRAAAVKAMGELDSLLDWLDGFNVDRHHGLDGEE
ncbi:interleukin 19 like [Megalops cyprinoides]|uniref:interleukin 19 like n=1 Tax=Megalops cyprinoides TaxID=118141 RepID=UPI001863BB1A|nr:interleukin 19 like [Megalops cyprinoides]